jgi:hypothetical protein
VLSATVVDHAEGASLLNGHAAGLGVPGKRISNASTLFYLQQTNEDRVGKISFNNRLNILIPLLCDQWLNESEPNMKKT